MREACNLTIDCNECLAEFEHPLTPADESTDATYTATQPECPDCDSTNLSYDYEELHLTVGLNEDTQSIEEVIDQFDTTKEFLLDRQDEDWEFQWMLDSRTIVLHHEPRPPSEYDFS